MRIDFTGSAPPCAGPLNISRATTVAGVYVALKHLFPDVAANAGVMEPIEIVVPSPSLLDAERPSPTGGYTETVLRMIDVLFCVFAEIRPAAAYGNAYGTINALSIAGRRADGARWVLFSFFGGGHGGNPEGDGLSHGNPPIATAIIPPVEVMEAAYPVRYTQWALRSGSGGAGAHRGGMGAIYEIELLADEADAFVFAERARFAPKGVLGGGDGACNVVSFRQDGVWTVPALGSKAMDVRLRRGDRSPAGNARRRRVGSRVSGLVLGVDVGGTFTDLFLFDEAAGSARIAKVASTRGAEATGFLSGARGIADVAALSAIVHGTTAGTNAILERTGRARRADHHRRVSRRAGDAPAGSAADLGLVGLCSSR